MDHESIWNLFSTIYQIILKDSFLSRCRILEIDVIHVRLFIKTSEMVYDWMNENVLIFALNYYLFSASLSAS